MKKIKIARTPTINEALKSELKHQEENEKLLQKAWEDKYGIDEPYGVTDWRDWTYDDDDDY